MFGRFLKMCVCSDVLQSNLQVGVRQRCFCNDALRGSRVVHGFGKHYVWAIVLVKKLTTFGDLPRITQCSTCIWGMAKGMRATAFLRSGSTLLRRAARLPRPFCSLALMSEAWV